MNQEFPDVQAGFRKCRETRDQIVNLHWMIVKAMEFQTNSCFCFINYTEAFDCVDHNKLENSSRDKKAFLSDQCKEIEGKTTEREKLEISSRKLKIPREHFMQRWADKGQKWYGPNRSRRY